MENAEPSSTCDVVGVSATGAPCAPVGPAAMSKPAASANHVAADE